MKNLIAILMLVLGVAASAEEKKKSYDTFNLVKTRNIFDPNRRAVREEQPRESREFRTRPNWIALTGTMVTDGRALAFFNSSRADARKVVGVGEMVADYKVLAVTPVQVEWEHEGKRSVLAVGRQIETSGTTNEPIEPAPVDGASAPAGDAGVPAASMAPPSRSEGGQSRERGEFSRDRDRRDRGGRDSSSRENAQPSSVGSSPSSSSPSSADQSEVLRKMMERRQKELSK